LDSYILLIFSPGLFEDKLWTRSEILKYSRLRTIKIFKHSRHYGKFQDIEDFVDIVVQGENFKTLKPNCFIFNSSPTRIKMPPPRLVALRGGCLVLAKSWARQVM
jgi:hypothetical protein